MIKLDNVSFSYPNSCSSALNKVNLTLEEGSFVAILGANGSGKSTFAKLLNAILAPTSGSVIIDGLNTLDKAKIYDIRSKVGLVFQNPDTQIICDTVEDELAFGLENIGLSVCEMQRRIDLSLSMTGLEPLRHTNPNSLSGGQKQMVCIASVLAMQSKYLVLDEATSMLDPQGRKLVLGFVESLHTSLGLSIIMITHNLEECSKADKVVLLENGAVKFEGSVASLLASPLLLDSSFSLPIATQLSQRLLPHNVLTVDEFCDAFLALARATSKGAPHA